MRKEKNFTCLHLCNPNWSDIDAGRQSVGTTLENFFFRSSPQNEEVKALKLSQNYYNLFMSGLGIDTSSPNNDLRTCELLGALAGLAFLFSLLHN